MKEHSTDRILLSIVIDSFNYGHFINQAVDSVLDQTLARRAYEVIVVDDGSTDDTPARMLAYGDAVRYIRKPNGGQASAFNMGVALAQGDIICFLDADDYFYSDKLERVVANFRDNHDAGVVYNGYDIVDESGNLLAANMPRRLATGDTSGRTLLGFVSGSPSSGISVRREVAMRVRIPEPPFRISADNFYLHILPLMTKVSTITGPLHAYRLHSSNLYLRRADSERVAVLNSQTEAIWDYAHNNLGQQFFRALFDLGRLQGRGMTEARFSCYRVGCRDLRVIPAPLWIKAWTWAKLTAKLMVSGQLYERIYHLRNATLSRRHSP